MGLPLLGSGIANALTQAGTKPGVLRSIAEFARRKGAKIGDGASDVIGWARKNPVQALVTTVSLGYPVTEMLSDDALAELPEDIRHLLEDPGAYPGDLYDAVSDELISLSKMDFASSAANLEIARDVTEWARRHFGGVQNAKDAHRMMQSFFSMSSEDVSRTFDLFN